jgi:hypothetical protein
MNRIILGFVGPYHLTQRAVKTLVGSGYVEFRLPGNIEIVKKMDSNVVINNIYMLDEVQDPKRLYTFYPYIKCCSIYDVNTPWYDQHLNDSYHRIVYYSNAGFHQSIIKLHRRLLSKKSIETEH